MALPGVYTKEEETMLERWKKSFRSYVGWLGEEPNEKESYPVVCRIATRELMIRKAKMIDYWNPLWRDEKYARNTRWGDIIAPPMFIYLIAFGPAQYPIQVARDLMPASGGVRSEDLNQQESFGPHVREIPPERELHNWDLETVYNFYKPIRVNDSFRVFVMLTKLEDKTNPDGSGPRIFKTINGCKVYNEDNDLVCLISVHAEFTMMPEPGKRKNEISYLNRLKCESDIEEYKYTEEEIEYIDKIADEEEVRGSRPRHWEDVNVGDELKQIVHGPITVWDHVCMISSFGVNSLPMREVRRKTPQCIIIDPETNVPHKTIERHLTERVAELFGAPITNMGEEIVMSRLITNWMGDDGFLRRYAWKTAEGYLRIGDTWFGRGNIVKKYIENGEYLVDLEVWVESMKGNKIVGSASATISLPSYKECRLQ